MPSRICPLLRSTCTTRAPDTHWTRSLSGVQLHTFSTAASCARDRGDHGHHGPRGENGRTAAKIMSAPAAYRAAFCMPNSTYFEGKLRSAPPLPIPEGRPRAAPPRNKKQPWRVCHGNQWRVGAFEPSESEFRHGAISAHV